MIVAIIICLILALLLGIIAAVTRDIMFLSLGFAFLVLSMLVPHLVTSIH